MVSGYNYYNDPIALESAFGGGMVFYSMAVPQMNEVNFSHELASPSVETTSPVIRTTFPESWIFDTEFDNG